MSGTQTPTEAARWADICKIYTRRQELSGADDPASKAVVQLAKLSDQLGNLRAAMHEVAVASHERGADERRDQAKRLEALIERLAGGLDALKASAAAAVPTQPTKIEVINTLPKYYANLYAQQIQVIEKTLIPAVEAMGAMMGQTINAREHLGGIANELKSLMAKQAKSNVIEGRPELE